MKPRYRAKTKNGEHVVWDFLSGKAITSPFATRAQAARFARKFATQALEPIADLPDEKPKRFRADKRSLCGGAFTKKLVQHFTGHDEYKQRRLEAEFILKQFKATYRASALRRGSRGRVIAETKKSLHKITPDLLFRLRSVYQQSRKIMDAENV